MKRKYINPNIEIININSKDIITTSDLGQPEINPEVDDW